MERKVPSRPRTFSLSEEVEESMMIYLMTKVLDGKLFIHVVREEKYVVTESTGTEYKIRND